MNPLLVPLIIGQCALIVILSGRHHAPVKSVQYCNISLTDGSKNFRFHRMMVCTSNDLICEHKTCRYDHAAQNVSFFGMGGGNQIFYQKPYITACNTLHLHED